MSHLWYYNNNSLYNIINGGIFINCIMTLLWWRDHAQNVSSTNSIQQLIYHDQLQVYPCKYFTCPSTSQHSQTVSLACNTFVHISFVLFMKVFPGYKFYPLAQLSENVPILTCGAISKRLVIYLLQYFLIKILLFEKELCGRIENKQWNQKQFLDGIVLWLKVKLHVD